jgi:hypothetical protein
MRCKAAQEVEFTSPEPVSKPIKPDGVKARVTEKYLQGTTCSRVPIKYRIDIFSNGIKHFDMPSISR